MMEMVNAAPGSDLLPIAISTLNPRNASMLKPEPPLLRCGLCWKTIRGRPMQRIYVAKVATEPYGRNLQTMMFPIAWRFDDDEQYDESCWYYIDGACAQNVPDGYIDALLRAVKVGQEVRVKESLGVKEQYRGAHGVVTEVPGGDLSPSSAIVVEHRLRGLVGPGRAVTVEYELGVLESEGRK